MLPPAYFSINAQINKDGYESLDSIKLKALTKLSIAAFKSKSKSDCIILDTRPADVFTHGFVPGSISIGLEGRFAEWAGSILSFSQPILLITEPGKEEETIIRLARVGFSKMEGYLKGGFEAWEKAGEKIDLIIDHFSGNMRTKCTFRNFSYKNLIFVLKSSRNINIANAKKSPEI